MKYLMLLSLLTLISCGQKQEDIQRNFTYSQVVTWDDHYNEEPANFLYDTTMFKLADTVALGKDQCTFYHRNIAIYEIENVEAGIHVTGQVWEAKDAWGTTKSLMDLTFEEIDENVYLFKSFVSPLNVAHEITFEDLGNGELVFTLKCEILY